MAKKQTNKKPKKPTKNLDDESFVIKKKPSKAELKSVIEELKKREGNLLVFSKKALHYTPYYLKSEGLNNKLLKEIVKLWAEGSDKVRVVCLLCIVRNYTKLKDKERKQDITKKMYASFLEKCRITKPETMAKIAFMRHSLIEIFSLDIQLACKQAQSALHQLIMTLKNAFTHKNEETLKTVMNWQFANCLILFSDLMKTLPSDSLVKSLTQQVIELNMGALHLLVSPRYYPFYCHLFDNLINIGNANGQFIPVLPLLLDILGRIKHNSKEKSKKVENGKKLNGKKANNGKNIKKKNESDSDNEDDNEERSNVDDEERKPDQKEYNLDLLNHVSLDESHTEDYQKAVACKLYELLVKYLGSQCHKIAFPELVLVARIHLKKWTSSNHKISAPFKTLLAKIEDDCSKIEKLRSNVEFTFDNHSARDAWERQTKSSANLSLIKLAATIN